MNKQYVPLFQNCKVVYSFKLFVSLIFFLLILINVDLLFFIDSNTVKWLIAQFPQAPLLKDRYGVCHLSTGDMLRAEISSGSTLGKDLKSILAAGEKDVQI